MFNLGDGVHLIEPYPLECVKEAYAWHLHTPTIVNGMDVSEEIFIPYLAGILSQPNVRSYAFLTHTPETGIHLAGIGVFDPIWRGGEIADGNIHICLSRELWGKQIIDRAASQIVLPKLFNTIPSLLRVSAQTPSYYKPGLRVTQALGFSIEGVLKDAVRIQGKVRDLTLTGLTRKEFYERQRT